MLIGKGLGIEYGHISARVGVQFQNITWTTRNRYCQNFIQLKTTWADQQKEERLTFLPVQILGLTYTDEEIPGESNFVSAESQKDTVVYLICEFF